MFQDPVSFKGYECFPSGYLRLNKLILTDTLVPKMVPVAYAYDPSFLAALILPLT